MNRFKPGDESCALHEYAELLSALDGLGALDQGQREDLFTENQFAMGNCARACLDRCMAGTFFHYSADPAPHTRHPEVPLIVETCNTSIAGEQSV